MLWALLVPPPALDLYQEQPGSSKHCPAGVTARDRGCGCSETLSPPPGLSDSSGSISSPVHSLFFFFPKGDDVEVGDKNKNKVGYPAPRICCPFQHRIAFKLMDEGRLHTAFFQGVCLQMLITGQQNHTDPCHFLSGPFLPGGHSWKTCESGPWCCGQRSTAGQGRNENSSSPCTG